jgi:hypothetical protein
MAYNKNFQKKKKKQGPVCCECLSSSEDRWFFWIDASKLNEYVMIPHNVLICDVCLEKLGLTEEDTHSKWDERRKKKIDTKGWVEGEPTPKGNKRYIFLKEDGTETLLILDSGMKKGFKPKMK